MVPVVVVEVVALDLRTQGPKSHSGSYLDRGQVGCVSSISSEEKPRPPETLHVSDPTLRPSRHCGARSGEWRDSESKECHFYSYCRRWSVLMLLPL